MFDVSAPLLILQIRELANRAQAVEAVTVYGRRITATVRFQDSTAEGIDRALRFSWLLQLDADAVASCCRASFEQDMRDSYALDNPDSDPTIS